jgi:hypothetical protein
MDKIAARREQLEQQLLDIEQMKLELDTAEERCLAGHGRDRQEATRDELKRQRHHDWPRRQPPRPTRPSPFNDK